MVPTNDFEPDELLPFSNHLSLPESRAAREILILRSIRWIGSEPERVGLVANPHGLSVDKPTNLFRGTDSELSVGFGDSVEIVSAGPAALKEAIEPARDVRTRLAAQILRGDAPKGRLCRAGWNGHRLKEKPA